MELLNAMLHATRPVRSRIRAAIRLALCFVLWPASVGAAETELLEYDVKAAYLYKFGLFIEWPSAAFASPASPLNLCVVGEGPIGPILDATAGKQRVNEREVNVRRLKTVGRDSGCHILYIQDSDAQPSGQIVAALRGSWVLTVTDSRAASGAGRGIINFVLKDNRMRFDIDDEAAAQNNLGISSKLLSLALSVKPRQARGGAK